VQLTLRNSIVWVGHPEEQGLAFQSAQGQVSDVHVVS
jgi:hypothetical protein